MEATTQQRKRLLRQTTRTPPTRHLQPALQGFARPLRLLFRYVGTVLARSLFARRAHQSLGYTLENRPGALSTGLHSCWRVRQCPFRMPRIVLSHRNEAAMRDVRGFGSKNHDRPVKHAAT